MEFRHLNLNEIPDWAEFCSNTFNSESAEYFSSHFYNDPWADTEGVFGAFDGKRIVASVRVFTRFMYYGGSEIKAGGIGEVCTDASYRRQGLSGKLLEKAIEYMNSHDMKISLLFTGTNHHYANYGWFTVPSRNVVLPCKKVKLSPDYHIKMADNNDYTVLRKLHGQYAPLYNGVTVRSDNKYWDSWMKREFKDVYILYRDDTPLAYADTYTNVKNNFTECHVREYIGERRCFMMLIMNVCGNDSKVIASSQYYGKCPQTFIEHTGPMLRLNKPFKAGAKKIDSVSKLFSLCSENIYFGSDSF